MSMTRFVEALPRTGTSVPFFTEVLGGLWVGPIKQDSLRRKSEAVLFCVCHVLAALHEEELAFVTGLFEGLDEVLFLCAVGFEKRHLVLYVDFSDGDFVSRCLAVDDADELIGTQVVFGADVDAVTAKLTTAVAATSAAAFTTGCSFPAGSAFSPALRAFAADNTFASYAAFRSCSALIGRIQVGRFAVILVQTVKLHSDETLHQIFFAEVFQLSGNGVCVLLNRSEE